MYRQYRRHYLIKGPTGFDSEVYLMVSMSRNEIDTRKRLFQTLNGEDNYALAA